MPIFVAKTIIFPRNDLKATTKETATEASLNLVTLCTDARSVFSRAATIHRCTGESRYFLSRYEYRYLNGISLYRETKYFSSKMKNYFTNIQKLVLISFMTPYPSTSLFLATGLRRCLVSFRMPPVTYISRWRHESMRSFNKLSADTVLCARNKNMRFAAVRSSRWFFRQNVFLCS